MLLHQKGASAMLLKIEDGNGYCSRELSNAEMDNTKDMVMRLSFLAFLFFFLNKLSLNKLHLNKK